LLDQSLRIVWFEPGDIRIEIHSANKRYRITAAGRSYLTAAGLA
jgi:hypothetical protein